MHIQSRSRAKLGFHHGSGGHSVDIHHFRVEGVRGSQKRRHVVQQSREAVVTEVNEGGDEDVDRRRPSALAHFVPCARIVGSFGAEDTDRRRPRVLALEITHVVHWARVLGRFGAEDFDRRRPSARTHRVYSVRILGGSFGRQLPTGHAERLE